MKPKIRFKGFSDDWEQREFSEVLDTNISTNSLSREMLTEEPTKIKNIHYGDILVKYREILSSKLDKIPYLIDDDKNKYIGKFLINGDVIFADAAEDETAGKASEINDLDEELVVSGLHTIVARPTQKFANSYLGYYLNSNAYHDQLLPLMQGTKVMSISKSTLSKTNISLTLDLAEQTEIGNYFKNIDNLITSHQKKYDKLVNIKKAMLEKMFPKNGEKTPEIRFDGFTDDWEQRELGEVARFYRGVGLSKDDLDINGINECILYGQLYTTYGMTTNKVYYRTNASKNNKFLSKNKDVLIPSSDTTPTGLARATSIEKSDVILGGDINVLRPNENIDGCFLSLNINSKKNELIKLIKGTTVKHIYNNDIKNVIVGIPNNLPEQTEIGNFFKSLDDLIASNKKELEKLKNIKKSMLEKMFI